MMRKASLSFLNVGFLAVLACLAINLALPVQAQVPTINTQPSGQVVSVGASVSFNVQASGGAPLGYQWRFNAANISGQTSNSLHLSNVTTNQAGNYTVVVSNGAGSVTSAPAALVVIPVLPGALDLTFEAESISDLVRAVAVTDDGKILIAGLFTTVGTNVVNRIARLNSNGTLDSTFNSGSGANGNIFAMAVQTNGQIIIGGAFGSFDGNARIGVARLQSDGSLDMTFDPGGGPDGAVWAVAAQSDGKVLIGGDFTSVNSAPRHRIARLNSNGSRDDTFTPGVVNSSVRSVAVQANGQVLIGGGFSAIDATTRFNLARLDSNGVLDPGFDPAPNNWVFSIVVQPNGQILVGGSFNVIRGNIWNRIARLNNDGTLDTVFYPGAGANDGVAAIALQPDGRILIGGGFTQFDGRSRHRIARLRADGSLDDIFAPDPGADHWIEAVALQSDGKVVVGGYFSTVNNVERSRVARLIGGNPQPFAPIISNQPTNQTTGEGANATLAVRAFAYPAATYQWQRNATNLPGATNAILSLPNVRTANAGNYRVVVWNPLGSATSVVAVLTVQPAPTNPGAPDIDFYSGAGPNGPVNAVAIQNDGKVLIGGAFSQVDGAARVSIARLNQNGSLDATFNPNGGASNVVNAVALQGDKILIGGGFYSVNGVIRYGIARLNSNGSLDASFDPTPNFFTLIQAVLPLANGQMVIGGYQGVWRLNTNGSVDSGFNVSMSLQVAPQVRGLAVRNDGKLFIGGNFTSVNSTPRNRIALLNTNGLLDTAFDPGSGANSAIYALALQPDGRVLIAGAFTRVNGIPRNRIARLDAGGNVDPTFDPGFGPNDNVESLALQPNGKIVIAGRFTAVNGVANSYVARLQSDGSPDLTFDSHLGPNDRVHSVALAGDGKVVIGGEFTRVNDAARPYVARLLGGDPPGFAPVIVEQPASHTVAAGEDVTFAVLARGVPAPVYQWQFNGTNISGANTWTLTLHNIRVAQAGTYTVTVSNALGSVSSAPAFLTVVPPPRNAGAPDIGFYSGFGPNDRVNAVAVQNDGKIIIGGAFTEVDGTNRNYIARLNRNGRLDPAFAPAGANNYVNAVAIQSDGRVLIGGEFFRVNDTNRNGIARLNTDGSLDLSFDAGNMTLPQVYAVALQPDGRVLIGGTFTSVGGFLRNSIARLNSDGSLDATFNAFLQTYSAVYTLEVQVDGKILIGGAFTSVGGMTRTHIARLNANGSLDAAFNPLAGASSFVLDLQLQEDARILLGGAFGFVNTSSRPYVARLNSDGILDSNFNPGSGANNQVHSLALQPDHRILVGGSFTIFANASRNRIARLNSNGSLDLTFNTGSGVTDGTSYIDEYGEFVDLTLVASIARQGEGKVIVGGDFTKVNGVTRRYVARLFEREALPLIYIRTLPPSIYAGVELTWDTGTLQMADQLDGPWIDVLDAESPHLVTTGNTQKFFRLKFN